MNLWTHTISTSSSMVSLHPDNLRTHQTDVAHGLARHHPDETIVTVLHVATHLGLQDKTGTKIIIIKERKATVGTVSTVPGTDHITRTLSMDWAALVGFAPNHVAICIIIRKRKSVVRCKTIPTSKRLWPAAFPLRPTWNIHKVLPLWRFHRLLNTLIYTINRISSPHM